MGNFVSIFFMALLALTGCSTPAEIKSKPPIHEGNSEKNSKDIAACLGDALESLNASTYHIMNVRPTSKGYSVTESFSWGSQLNTVVVFDIFDKQNGSSYQVYFNTTIGLDSMRFFSKEKMVKMAKNCE